MNRVIILLIGLLVQAVASQAQSTQTSNSLNQSGESATKAIAPARTNATESPFYIKLYGSYGLLTPGVQIRYSESLSQTGQVFPFKTTNKGLGAGPRAGIGIGVIVSDFINLGIDADILFGTAIKINNSYTDDLYSSSNTSSTTLKLLSITPNITFKALSRPAYYIYNRLGLVGGLVMEYKTVNNRIDLPTSGVGVNTTNVTTNSYTENSLALGYQAALGVQFRLSQAIRGFVEVVAYNQSFKPKRLEVASTDDVGGQITNKVVVTEFKDEGNIVNSTTAQPNQSLSFNVSVNSVGIGAGLVVRF
ncbi:hypothetical protein [Spirosoma sp. KNUC1025]|uniref:hypothetical protein n=1 Tax=Spirosoma sp. KNUC1025 TaxID=2894082 RepID=UPI00386E1B2B|nr:hypothetical protein LN737_17730 [Spirosoma sp. KNUC1025]